MLWQNKKTKLLLPTSTCVRCKLCFFITNWKFAQPSLQLTWDSSCKTTRATPQQDGMGDEPTSGYNVQNSEILWWVLGYEELIVMWEKIAKENNDFATQAWKDDVQEKQAWNSRIDAEEKWSWCLRINVEGKLRRRRRASGHSLIRIGKKTIKKSYLWNLQIQVWP